MFVRVKTVRSGARTYRYLHIVENRWEDGRARQHIVGSLGRLDELQAKGDLEQVVRQLVEHCPSVKLRVRRPRGRFGSPPTRCGARRSSSIAWGRSSD